jgi:hypothetical protein
MTLAGLGDARMTRTAFDERSARSDASTSDQLVAGVFRDHAAGEAALAEEGDGAPALAGQREWGLTLGKGSGGKITAAVVDLPGPHVLPANEGFIPLQ